MIPDFDPGIPMLDPSWQAEYYPASWQKWGTVARSKQISGGYYFYISDYKFNSLWKKDPGRVPRSGCSCLVEVNFTTTDQMAGAVALYRIWKKRRLSHLWGSQGVKLFADLNVAPRWRGLALLGVPRGWAAYATRSHHDRGPAEIEADFASACAHAGTDKILFVVFGGVARVRALCLARGWHHVPEQCRTARGLDL